jgi:hypothetical protein
MIVVAGLLLVLGVVSIVMGFWPHWPSASVCGAVFFVGGWVLIGLDRIVWRLEKVLGNSSSREGSDTPGEE